MRWVIVMAVLLGCADEPARDPGAASGPAAVAVAGETVARAPATHQQAHIILEQHCGECHRDDVEEPVAPALDIFNLNEPDWYAGITPEQLTSAKRRIDEQASDADKRLFDAFIAAELARRNR